MVFAAVKIQVEVFWVVTPCSVVVGNQRFGCPCCLHLHPQDEGSTDIWNLSIVSHYTVSQPRRRCLKTVISSF